MTIGFRLLSIVLPFSILVVGAVSLLAFSKDPKRFPLHGVEIRGDLKHFNADELKQVISQHMKQGFFWLNVKDVQKSIATLPWVAAVAVERVWPDRIRVSIEEQIPQAIWNEMAVLSTQGNIFYPELSSLPEKLPHFNGPESRANEMRQQYFVFLEMLSPLRLAISELNVSPDGTWRINLDNGLAIILGKAALNERMGRFVLAYPSSLLGQKSKIAYLDFRYPNGFAIGWKSKEGNREGSKEGNRESSREGDKETGESSKETGESSKETGRESTREGSKEVGREAGSEGSKGVSKEPVMGELSTFDINNGI